MKKIIATSLGLLLAILISALTIRPIHAGITPPITWIKPVRIPTPDPFLGTVSVAYIAGSTWIVNVRVTNDATNGTDPMDARVYRIAVWFDWNRFYNTTVNVLIKNGDTYLFTVNGTMESTSIASNLFTHSYKVYVEYEITYQSGGGTVTQKKTWGPSTGSNFAVLSQQQYDSVRASLNYDEFEDEVDGYVDDYAESFSLYVQAEREAEMGDTSYLEGEFSSALLHYNTALDLLDQSWTKYTTIKAEDDSITLDKKQAELDAMKANTTAILAHANAVATATVINAVAFAFFGIGFIFFGIAAIFYARKPKPTQ
jgi:hypothetical protein